jgi:hypothetical protein
MSQYVKRLVTILVSDYSDYEQPMVITTEEETAPAETFITTVSCPTAAGQAIVLTPYTTAATVWVKNTDTTNFVTVTYTTVAGGATTLKLTAGQDITLRNVNTAETFSVAADTAACVCQVAKL